LRDATHQTIKSASVMSCKSGASLTGVRDALGHASLETTNRYAHGTEDGKRRDVEAQEQYLQKSGHKSVTKIKKQAG